MASTAIDLLAPVHRLTVAEYRRMDEIGLFDEGPRVELIEGVLVEMSPIGPAHERAVIWLTRILVPQLDDAHVVSPQGSVVMAERHSVPQPDVAIRSTEEVLDGRQERAALIVEISVSTLRFDRITKSRLYARHRIADYWIVNVADEVVEVHRDPSGDTWGTRTVHRAGGTLRPLLLPAVGVELGPLFEFIAGRAAPRG